MNIPDMDYIILLISDSNKKSSNCMYEVLEVIRERKYFNKIFPGVIDSRICNPIMRAKHVKYWKKRVRELNAELTIIE